MSIYNEGLNNDFCKFIAEKVKYNLYISVGDALTRTDLFNITTNNENYLIKPLFNFDSVTSSNPADHTEYNNVLVLNKITSTMLSFKSDVPIMEYSEISSENTLSDVHYTLYYTYDRITGEPAPHKMTSCGSVTDDNAYYLDSEVIE